MAFTILRTFIVYLAKLMLFLNRQVPISHFTQVVTRVIWMLHLSGLPLVMLLPFTAARFAMDRGGYYLKIVQCILSHF